MTTHIRWMIRKDLPAVLDIELESFEFPWTEFEFIRTVRQQNCICQVAEWDDKVLGFMVYRLERGALTVLNLAVSKDVRRKGVGSDLICKLIDKLHPANRTRIFADVRERNLGAQLFFRTMGFKATHIIRKPFDDTDEPAYRFQLRCCAPLSWSHNRLASVVG